MREIMKLPKDSKDFKDEFLLNAKICWMVTNNMEILFGKKRTNKNSNNISMDYVKTELYNNKNLTFFQDTLNGGDDHWFSVIGENGNAYIIEMLPEVSSQIKSRKFSYKFDTIENIVSHLLKIKDGNTPDRFYNNMCEHIYRIYSQDRIKPISSATVYDCLQIKL